MKLDFNKHVTTIKSLKWTIQNKLITIQNTLSTNFIVASD